MASHLSSWHCFHFYCACACFMKPVIAVSCDNAAITSLISKKQCVFELPRAMGYLVCLLRLRFRPKIVGSLIWTKLWLITDLCWQLLCTGQTHRLHFVPPWLWSELFMFKHIYMYSEVKSCKYSVKLPINLTTIMHRWNKRLILGFSRGFKYKLLSESCCTVRDPQKSLICSLHIGCSCSVLLMIISIHHKVFEVHFRRQKPIH